MSHFSLANVGAWQLVGWATTIIAIWFVGMTLYQRIFAARDVKAAKRAWYLAGLLAWPTMALLGTLARVAFPAAEPETGLPRLIKDVLPAGIAGLVVAAYFSAIMSTADICLCSPRSATSSPTCTRGTSRPTRAPGASSS